MSELRECLSSREDIEGRPSHRLSEQRVRLRESSGSCACGINYEFYSYSIPLEVVMPSKPTATDAELILKLYDLRREPEMRKAAIGGS